MTRCHYFTAAGGCGEGAVECKLELGHDGPHDFETKEERDARAHAERPRTLGELQDELPWGAHNYSELFRSNPQAHRDFAHALLHVQKAAGKLAAVVDDGDHNDEVAPHFAPEKVDRFLADLIICTLRMANTCPAGRVDLEKAVQERLKEKFGS